VVRPFSLGKADLIGEKMGILTRFFGREPQADDRGGDLVATRRTKSPLSLQVLFQEKFTPDAGRLTEAMRSYHISMKRARFEIDPGLLERGTVLGLAGWGKHVVQLVGFDGPMPADAVERCVAPSHYGQELKAAVRRHTSHLVLYYAGNDSSPYEQYLAMAAMGGVLSQFGAIAILNESAQTSFPAEALAGAETEGDIMEMFREFPLLMLFCGFVKCHVEGIDGVWMRTYGAPRLGLSDLAAHAEGHHEGERYFNMFENILRYMRDSPAKPTAGHTMQVGDKEFLRFRAPKKTEAFLGDDGDLLVVELVGRDEMNR
jgi:Domain of unknown function (DUF4261)